MCRSLVIPLVGVGLFAFAVPLATAEDKPADKADKHQPKDPNLPIHTLTS